MNAMMKRTMGRTEKNVVRMLAVGSLATFLALGASSAWAGNYGGGFNDSGAAANTGSVGVQGGFTGSGNSVVTVKEALTLRDDSWVTLRGKITRRLGGEEYSFSDGTGTITVEIDDDDWMGQAVGPNDTVVLHGEVDKDWMHTEIDVKQVIKQQ